MSVKPEILLPIGLPASGKTILSKEWLAEDPDARIRINYDELRVGIFGDGWVWNRKDEEAMKANAKSIVSRALKAGLSVVIDNTNLSRHVRASWAELARQLGAEYIEHDVSTPLDVCIARDRVRGQHHARCRTLPQTVHSGGVVQGTIIAPGQSCDCGASSQRVGQAVIDRMAMQYGLLDWNVCECVSRPIIGKCIEPPPKDIAIVDIDGTVADCSARLRHLKPNPAVECTGCGKRFNIGPDETCLCDPKVHPLRRIKNDWQAFFAEVANDKPITRMIRLISKLEQDHLIVFISGRPIQSGTTKVGILTEDWLRSYLIQFDRLFLRQTDDHQPDFEYKKAVLDHLPKDRVAYVFEDREQCVKMYRDELKKAGSDAIVMQVAEGSY